ncbi:hypothetical protein GQ457_12G001100 [Hibiscus cannabinus]
MASLTSWSSKFLLMTLTTFTIIAKPSVADPVFRSSPWASANATFYGGETTSGTMGGACGYGDVFSNGYGKNTVALSTTLFKKGYACGTCYQVQCAGSPSCHSGKPSITVTATNFCPPSGWCKPPRAHFDLSKPAFMKIAQWKAGIVPIKYRRVPCNRTGGVRFLFEGNKYWLSVFVMNVGGGGDVSNMWVKGSKTEWIEMKYNWGASYHARAQLGGQSLSFKLTSDSTKETIIARDAAPENWKLGSTYKTRVNFH